MSNERILDGLAILAEDFEAKGCIELSAKVDQAALLLGADKQMIASTNLLTWKTSCQSGLERQVKGLDLARLQASKLQILATANVQVNEIVKRLQKPLGSLEMPDLLDKASSIATIALACEALLGEK
jgi:hypothetical protein